MAEKGKQVQPSGKEAKANRKVRIAQVLDWLVGCVPTGEIEKLGAKKYGVTTRCIRKDIAHCRHKILPTWFEWSDKRVMAGELLAKLERIAAKAIAKDDLHAAIRAIRQTSELMGLNSARQIANERDTLAQQIAEMRANRNGDSGGDGRGAPIDQVNAFRGAYGMPMFKSPAEYEHWLTAQSSGKGN